jgi:hypothetical protein
VTVCFALITHTYRLYNDCSIHISWHSLDAVLVTESWIYPYTSLDWRKWACDVNHAIYAAYIICSSLLGMGCIYQMLHLTSYAFASPVTSIKPSLLQFISGLLHLNGVSASPMLQTLQNNLKRYPILSKLVCISFPINSSFFPDFRIIELQDHYLDLFPNEMLVFLFCCVACSCGLHWDHLVTLQHGYHTSKPSCANAQSFVTALLWSLWSNNVDYIFFEKFNF